MNHPKNDLFLNMVKEHTSDHSKDTKNENQLPKKKLKIDSFLTYLA